MKQFHILVLFVFSQTKPNYGQEWIRKIGIDAASKLSLVLHDDNHTNIVLLEKNGGHGPHVDAASQNVRV